MPTMIKTRSFKQSKMMCGPASLKIVADYYGIQVSEKRLAKLCRANKYTGTSGKNLATAARIIGFEAHITDNSNFNAIKKWLEKKVPVIVDWMSPGQSRPVNKTMMADGHYSVVVGLTSTHIVLEDPGPGQRRKIKRSDFMKVWFDWDSEYLKKKSDLILRRFITVYPKSFSKRVPRQN